MAFISPIYQVPLGIGLGGISINRFSGEPTSGLLTNISGAVFFSPALLNPNSGNQIDLDNIEVNAHASDIYYQPPGSLNKRIFTWGPNSPAKTNENKWTTTPKHYTAIAIMVQTIPPGPTTIFKIP